MTGSGRSLFVQDGPSRILKIDTVTGTIALLAEKNDPLKSYGPMWSDGRYLYARFGTRIDRINLETGESEVFAGTNLDDYVDATGEEARFRLPSGIWGDDVSLYVADYGNQAIRSIDLGSGAVTTFANLSGTPRGIWSDGTHVFVTDPTGLHKIDRSTRSITTLVRVAPRTLLDGSTETGRLGPGLESIWGDDTFIMSRSSGALHSAHS